MWPRPHMVFKIHQPVFRPSLSVDHLSLTTQDGKLVFKNVVTANRFDVDFGVWGLKVQDLPGSSLSSVP